MTTATFVVWLAMNVSGFMDYRQTMYIARHPAQHHELNPLIGEHPSAARVNAHFAVGAIVKNAAFFALPVKYRIPFGAGMTAISTSLVIYNNSVGIKINF